MDKIAHMQIIKDRIARQVEAFLPNGAGTMTETRLRHALEAVAQEAFSQGEAYALMNLLTVRDAADRLGVSYSRMRALIRNRHERFGVGMKISEGNRTTWLIRESELEQLQPGPSGRPSKA